MGRHWELTDYAASLTEAEAKQLVIPDNEESVKHWNARWLDMKQLRQLDAVGVAFDRLVERAEAALAFLKEAPHRPGQPPKTKSSQACRCSGVGWCPVHDNPLSGGDDNWQTQRFITGPFEGLPVVTNGVDDHGYLIVDYEHYITKGLCAPLLCRGPAAAAVYAMAHACRPSVARYQEIVASAVGDLLPFINNGE